MSRVVELEEKIIKLRKLAYNNANPHKKAAAEKKIIVLEREIEQIGLQEVERQLKDLERIAAKNEFIAAHLRKAVANCRQQKNLEGIDEMVAFAFNALAHTPSYGGAGSNLPAGKYKGVIVDIRQEKTTAGTGGFLAFDLTPIEGPCANQKHTDRLNIHNLNPETVRIANQQLSAYCHVTGVFNIQDLVQLYNIPFFFEIGFQKGQEPSEAKPEGGYTEVKAIFDINGNSPGKAQPGGAAPVATPVAPAQPAAAVAPTAAAPSGWEGAPAQPADAAPVAPAVAPAAAWGGPPADAAPVTPAAPAAGASALPPGWG